LFIQDIGKRKKEEKHMLVVNAENYEDEVVKADTLVMLDFYADWCGPCRMLGPIVEQIAEETQGSIKVGKVNVDQNQELASKFAIMSIPTLVFLKNGEMVAKLVGLRDKHEIMQEIEKWK